MAATQEAVLKRAPQPIRNRRLRYCVDNEWRESRTARYMPVMDPSSGEQVAVTKGLDPGQVIVTDGADRLKDGAKIQVVQPAAQAPAQPDQNPAQPGQNPGQRKRDQGQPPGQPNRSKGG